MTSIPLEQFQADPESLLSRVAAGEHVVLTRSGAPVAEVGPVAERPTGPRPVGLCKGQFVVPDDFDDPLPEEILRDFEGR